MQNTSNCKPFIKITAVIITALFLFSGCGFFSKETSSTVSEETSQEICTIEDSLSGMSENAEISGDESTADTGDIAATTSERDSSTFSASQATAIMPASKTTAVAASKTTAFPATEAATVTTAKPVTVSSTKASTSPASTAPVGSYNPVNYSEIKAIWISYLELAQSYSGDPSSPLLKGRTAGDFRAQMQKVYENCLSIGINTVFMHVRPFGDAVYTSSLFPASYVVTGTAGAALPFDPLAIMIDEAHKKGISFHAWINPFRAQPVADAAGIASLAPWSQFAKWYKDSSKNGDCLVASNGRYYYNPSAGEARQLIISGVEELIRGYNLDGIHIDDYFYPENIGSDFDGTAYTRYKQDGGTLSLADFRRDCNNLTVKGIYQKIKGLKSGVVFSVSPSGNMDYNYSTMYTDVALWLKTEGYLDVIIPQIYYGFNHVKLPYTKCLESWNALIKTNSVKLVTGLAAYKVGSADKFAGTSGVTEWIDNGGNMLCAQISEAKKQNRYAGYSFYDYKSLFFPEAGKADMIRQELSKLS